MKSLLAILIVTASSANAAQVCGFYQREDFGDRVAYTISEIDPTFRHPVSYSVQNPASNVGSSLIGGRCYCVIGTVRPDLEFYGDSAYRVLLLDNVVAGPTSCTPL